VSNPQGMLLVELQQVSTLSKKRLGIKYKTYYSEGIEL